MVTSIKDTLKNKNKTVCGLQCFIFGALNTRSHMKYSASCSVLSRRKKLLVDGLRSFLSQLN